jgi:serine/threonine protein kinase
VHFCFFLVAISDDDLVRKTTMREIKMLRLLKHNHIVPLLDTFKCKGRLYLVFEFLECNVLELLEEHIGGLPEDTVRRLLFQLLQALCWCHQHSVVHRGNIVLEFQVCIIVAHGGCFACSIFNQHIMFAL